MFYGPSDENDIAYQLTTNSVALRPKLPDEKRFTKQNKCSKPTEKTNHPYQLFQPNPPMTFQITYSNAFPLIHFSRPGGMREAFE